MNNNSENTKGLKRSTKITVISCAGFVVMTFIVLTFFIMFPITPNERMISNLGRESYAKNNGEDNLISPIAVTTAAAGDKQPAKQTTVKADEEKKSKSSTTRTEFEIKITTGSGFLWNARIPTDSNPFNATVVAPNNFGENPNYVNVEDYLAQNGGVPSTEIPGNGDPGTAGGDIPNTVPDVNEVPAEPVTDYVDPNAGGYYDPNANTGGGYVDPNAGGYVDPNVNTGGYVDPNYGGGYVEQGGEWNGDLGYSGY